MLFMRAGWDAENREPRRDGEAVEVVKRGKYTKASLRRALALEMYLLRRKGLTDAEIGAKYRHHRVTVNRMINSIPSDAIKRLREINLV